MEPEVYPQEVLADEEPKYLRRQKPVEIKRRKFGGKAWKSYLRVTGWAAAGMAGAGLAYAFGHFLLTSPEMSLIHPEQVELERQPQRFTRQCARSFPGRPRAQRSAHSLERTAAGDRVDSLGRAGRGAARASPNTHCRWRSWNELRLRFCAMAATWPWSTFTA